ncbi:MAG: chloramphenicol acetyltransferase [Flavobacteriaceae bacterium]|nr:chloramphenicol acetyltransferase [Flavobacteriaceae bacterium]
MKELDINTWNRKQHFDHYMTLADPFFAVTVEVDVTKMYQLAKKTNTTFFARYLHACMIAINSIENFRYRIIEDKIYIYDEIAASATIARPDHTYGFSFIYFSPDFETFNTNFLREKERIVNSTDLFPPVNSKDCIYCSAIPWINFKGHKETFAGDVKDSIPRLAFGKVVRTQNSLMMPLAIAVNHALVDGHHVGLFIDEFQNNLLKI